MKIGGRIRRASKTDKRIFRRTAIKRSKRDNLVARGGHYN